MNLKFAVLLLSSSSAAAFNVAPWEAKKVQMLTEAKKNFSNVLAAGAICAATLLPLPCPSNAADSFVIGTPLETQLANFGAASYPVFNSISDVTPLTDKFLGFVDTKIKAPDVADVAAKAVDGLLAIPDAAITEYKGVLSKGVYAGVSNANCVTLTGSGATLQKLQNSVAAKSVDASKITALTKKFAPANSAVPMKGGDICLPPSAAASEKLWVAQAELTANMPKAEASALSASIKKAGLQATRPSLISLVSAAESTFSKSPEAIKMVAAGKAVEPSVIATTAAALK